MTEALNLNSEISSLTQTMAEAAPDYVPDALIIRELAVVTIVPIIGPLAVGKTSCMREIENHNPDFQMVRGFTTRPLRPGENLDNYRFYNHDKETLEHLNKSRKSGELVQYAIHPTTGYAYGSQPKDYSKPYEMLDTLATAMDGIRRLPFGDRIEIGMVAPVEEWWQRVAERGRGDLRERLDEAVISLEWLLDQGLNFRWVVNTNGHLTEAAAEVVGLARGETTPNPFNRIAGELLLESIHDELNQ